MAKVEHPEIEQRAEAITDVDESVRRIGDELDKWSGSIFATLASGDQAALGKALLEGFAFSKEINRLKKQGMAAISAVLESKADATDSERVASLVQAFAVGARLGDALRDELSDIDGKSKVWRLLDAILLALDKIGTGRAALAVLFDSPDAGVRAAAGAYLIDLMPERVVPMLRAIDEAGGGKSADFGANRVLVSWKADGKSRFNFLTPNT